MANPNGAAGPGGRSLWPAVLTKRLIAGTLGQMIDERDLLDDAVWRENAACLPFPAILFFGQDENEPPAERRAREDQAKVICETCGVRMECLEYAVAAKEQYGIWGGLTELERKAYQRAQGRKAKL